MKQFFQKKLLPAVTLSNAESAKRLADTYLKAGLDILEITFRTDATLAAIEAVAQTFPELHIGAGTILNPSQVQSAKDAGARFGLSPGFNEKVVESAHQIDFPFIPGVMTPSEIEQAWQAGCEILKLYPAEIAGGTEYIRSLEGPYLHAGLDLIPMGGVGPGNMRDYLDCASVVAVGGSWLAPKDKIREGDFAGISKVVEASLKTANLS
ncbi:bifunctional 4-hydroxy-2-oxoglutarate aldolase/2-dehydro-3-deoxy-phosphogluconate aldolase [Aliifodinibius sp. S!AR15-10]|uniref:bifunctional 4-hydroxy-2-oxoglutarate aldolase/2-dehydro-3-deoxy-phosphogluconate aldolase n=1 Tax=Aliifodinibius sp. S!AR15-10 TaxID=2950437 RepID=UPI00285BD99B|nr:bifunctional 4-hydroxy-2-oxoglutarate aldolase/2-dehydro-3-deoxy-phosphogluconate aldolase [Aliifodinibius sp. S!AR15-10]MDR8391104.1 bifunctional 4-hydroxy-2-oxoglutarate aldolase/2-dehydro-3-deoxy-phosphogluconate aldolase [Aliifodinibius sp. S!AR15-10]